MILRSCASMHFFSDIFFYFFYSHFSDLAKWVSGKAKERCEFEGEKWTQAS